MIEWVYNDGGRMAAGRWKATDTGDCVTRAIATALELPYAPLYDQLHEMQKRWAATSRSADAKRLKASGRTSPRDGVYREVYEDVLIESGCWWTPTMKVGSGCKVHVTADQLPTSGRHILRLSRHLTALVDGVILDTFDPSRGGSRCVYGIYSVEGLPTDYEGWLDDQGLFE